MKNAFHLLATIITASALIAGCRTWRTEHREPAPCAVVAAKVSFTESPDIISISGNIEGNQTVRLGFMVAGRINYIAATEGQRVSKGQVLSSIDPENYEIARDAADAQVHQLQDEYDRLKMMHDRQSLSDGDFNKIKFGLEQAQAQQRLQIKNLKETKLTSPMDGILLKKLTEVGEVVSTGLPLFVVADIHTVKVNAFVPESELSHVRIGQAAWVSVTSAEDSLIGKVTEVGSVADAVSRAFTVKIELPNPDLRIRPGMIAEVKLMPDHTRRALTIPVEAVLHDVNDQSYIFVVDSTQHRAFRRNVSLGRLAANEVEIVSGLEPGEWIVTGGQHRLDDGAAVTLK